MLNILRPRPTLTAQETQRSLRFLAWEGLASGAMFSLGSGGFMAAYALALGANNLEVGILAALPFMSQVVRLPAILLVERFRARKALGLPALVLSHLSWIPVGAVPFLLDTPGKLAVILVILFLAVRGLFAPVWVTTSTSWTRDLVPHGRLADYFSRRLALVTGAMAVVGLAGSFFVSWWQGRAAPGDEILAFSFLLMGGAITFGLLGPFLASRASEPLMPPADRSGRSPVGMLLEPIRDRNYFHLVRFLFIWSLLSNLAIPFFAVYMFKVIGLTLPVVIGLTVLGQFANVLFVRVWGPFADRVGNKTVLSLSASLYLLVIIGWVFTTQPERHFLTMPLLAVLHLLGGVAAAGVTLTVNTLALKVAPEGRTIPFSGVAGLAASLGSGIGPVLGGLLADFFATRSLAVSINWASSGRSIDLPAVTLAGFDFLFVIAFMFGLVSLNLLVALREEGEMSRDDALAELMAGTGPMARAVSSVPGLNMVSAFSYGYLRRIPGADVAIGVTAYQVAASTQAALESAGRGRAVTAEVARHVGDALTSTVDNMEDAAEQGLGLALHATRGALHAAEDLTDQVSSITRGAVLGSLRTLDRLRVSPQELLRGAAQGAIQGAVEARQDPAAVALAAVEAARESAPELGLTEEEAASAAAAGVLAAAQASGDQTVEAVIAVLPEDQGQPGRIQATEETGP
ncbi:MAG: MFS transporter [Chloroflexota bacterium]|nr:MFS transporter [Chloroflexota bacterium]